MAAGINTRVRWLRMLKKRRHAILPLRRQLFHRRLAVWSARRVVAELQAGAAHV